jgi:hypothetical protein
MWTTTESGPTPEIQIINRRGHDPQAEESDRLEKRRAIKARRARLFLAWTRQAELDKARRQIDVELDRLASDNEQRLEGVQGALGVLEKRMIADISQGRPTNPEDEQQRKQLLAEIDSANVQLQRDLKAVRERIPIVEKALYEIMHEAAQYQASERDLADRHAANPRLFREHLLAKNQADWASRRVAALSEQLEEFGDRVAECREWQRDQPGNDYSRDIARWQLLASDVEFCQSDAQAQLNEARREAERLRQAIIDE